MSRTELSSKYKLNFSDYLKFFLSKRRVITDCHEGKLQLLLVEIMWYLRNIIGLDIYSGFLIFKDQFKTTRGKFIIHRDLQSAISISPAFEAEDIDELLSVIGKHVKKKERILFVDVGAHIGIYAVSVGRKFLKYKNLDIVAFEPDANNFYENNSSILMQNIELNKISNFKFFKVGLGDKNITKPNKFGFITKRLDDIFSKEFAKKYDTVFMKIDIEGYEREALEGSKNFIKNSKNVIFLIEDCVNKSIFKYMENNFTFYKKISPYNSFWIK